MREDHGRAIGQKFMPLPLRVLCVICVFAVNLIRAPFVHAAEPAVAATPAQADAAPVAPAPPNRDEQARLFAVLRLMRQRLTISGETAFYVGQREMKAIHYHSSLYALAGKWVTAYREAVRRLQQLPISAYIGRPERILELQEAIRWGRRHAIAEPFYFKEGYRQMQVVLP